MVNHATTRAGTRLARMLTGAALVMLVVQMTGCTWDSYIDPSKTGRFDPTPTTIPILGRIDMIEHETDLWGSTTGVLPEDLVPSDLSYEMVPGDLVTVQIFELYAQNQWSTSTRRVGTDGTFRLPELGDVQAAGLTAQQFEDLIVRLLEEQVMANPQVDVVVEEGRAFRYTIYGFVTAPGVFTLQDPNLRLIDALAIAGGIQPTTERLFIIREVPLTDDVKPEFERDEGAPDAAPADESQPVDIEELIEQLDQDPGGVNPGAFRPQDDAPAEPPALRPIGSTQPPVVDVDDLPGNPDHEFVYIEELDRWVRTRSATDPVSGGAARELIVERIIEIPYQRLSHGDSSYNIVVRANDRIFVDGPPQGVIYIDGEIARPGVYNLPQTGRLTLSRLVAAAGGFGQLAVPTRVDLTRIVGDGHEATVRLNMSAIRQRTEPDLYLKADDHIIIGTTFWATPLAVVRNGLRATYGFGFLLDRNFGNDVFGAPPSDNNRF